MYRQTGVRKDPPQSQHSWIPSGCGDELERLRGADSKEAYTLFEDLEMHPEWGGRAGDGEELEGMLCRW